jgi:hypothetical protein
VVVPGLVEYMEEAPVEGSLDMVQVEPAGAIGYMEVVVGSSRDHLTVLGRLLVAQELQVVRGPQVVLEL